jgi:hypothetical protein
MQIHYVQKIISCNQKEHIHKTNNGYIKLYKKKKYQCSFNLYFNKYFVIYYCTCTEIFSFSFFHGKFRVTTGAGMCPCLQVTLHDMPTHFTIQCHGCLIGKFALRLQRGR